MYTYMESEFEKGLEEKGRIIANVKFVLKGEKEVPYISPKGYNIVDIELLYHAIKKATLSDLEQFKKQGTYRFRTDI